MCSKHAGCSTSRAELRVAHAGSAAPAEKRVWKTSDYERLPTAVAARCTLSWSLEIRVGQRKHRYDLRSSTFPSSPWSIEVGDRRVPLWCGSLGERGTADHYTGLLVSRLPVLGRR